MSWPYISPEERRITMVNVPVDVILSVPMFLRAYLLCRFMVLHSKQFQVSFDNLLIEFLIKSTNL